jgi:ubiquinone/menaquinone biosynthesis C-methylase UbiE
MSFDRLAPHYSWMEAVLAGKRLQRCRTAWLDALTGCETLLIAGVGHGHFLRCCAQRFPELRITSVDSSATMLRHARTRVESTDARMNRLTFVHAALPEWTPPAASFDAIATHFFLDCFPPDELRAVVNALSAAGKPSAQWLLTDFTVPSTGLARHRARAVHAVMYSFFRRVAKIRARRVTTPDELLRREGFELRNRTSAEWGLLHSDRWQRRLAA